MRLSENYNEVLQRAITLKRSKNVPDLEECYRLFKIYSKMTQNIFRKIETMGEAFDASLNLINILEHPDKKFWQFKVAAFLLIDILRHYKHFKVDDRERERTRRDVIELIKRLLISMAAQRMRCYEYIKCSEFKKIVQEQYDYKRLKEVLMETKTDISMAVIRCLPVEQEYYGTFIQLVERAYEETETERLSKAESASHFVPLAPDALGDEEVSEPFDAQFLDEFKHEFKRHLYLDEESFFRFLLRNYQVPLLNGFTLNEFDAEIMSYKKEIVSYFYGENFSDPTEKKVVKVIRDGLRQRKIV
jgi:hypothetical protein